MNCKYFALKPTVLLAVLSAAICGIAAIAPLAAQVAGDKAGHYLIDGKLRERIEVQDVLIGGFKGSSGDYYAVEPDGSWSTGSVQGILAVKGKPQAKGKLTQEQLAQLAMECARNDLVNLPNHGTGNVGSRETDILFGQKTVVLHAGPGKSSAEEDKAIRARYHGISQTVKMLCTVQESKARQVFKAPAGGITTLAISADGTTLAVAAGDKTVKVWDTVQGKELTTLREFAAPVTALAFSADGKILAALSKDKMVRVYDWRSGKDPIVHRDVPAQDGMLTIAADGKILLAHVVGGTIEKKDTMSDNWVEVRLLDVAAGKSRTLMRASTPAQIPGIGANFQLKAWTPDGRTLAVGSFGVGGDQSLTLVDTATGKAQESRLRLHRRRQGEDAPPAAWTHLAISKDGKTLASASDGRIEVKDGKIIMPVPDISFWDLDTGNVRATCKVIEGLVLISADMRTVVTVDAQGAITVWEPKIEPVRDVVREITLKTHDGAYTGEKKPTKITTAEELAKACPGQDQIAQQVDFTKEQCLFFAWKGSGGDKLSFKIEEGKTGPIIVFSCSYGKTDDLRRHFHLYAIPRNATWRFDEFKGAQKLKLQSTPINPEGKPIVLAIELDGQGGGKGTYSNDPNLNGEKGLGTLIGWTPVNITLKLIKNEHADKKGRQLYEISGANLGRMLLVVPTSGDGPCWLVYAGKEGALDIISMQRN